MVMSEVSLRRVEELLLGIAQELPRTRNRQSVGALD